MEKNKKRGVTLLETVIAMALAVIISVAAYMTCDFALKTQHNSEIKIFFTQEVENVAMCYYKSDNDLDKLEDALVFSLNIEGSDNYLEYTSSIKRMTPLISLGICSSIIKIWASSCVRQRTRIKP